MNSETIEDGFLKYNRFLKSYAYSILKNKEDSNDAVQETWIKALRHIDTFDQKKGRTYKSWLELVCKRTCIDVIRKRQTHNYFGHVEFREEFMRKNYPTIERDIMYNEMKLDIEKVLNNSKYVNLFRHLLNGHSSGTLHRETGISESTIKGQIQIIRKLINKHFDKKFNRRTIDKT